MSSASDRHGQGQGHSEQVFLYVLQALSPSEATVVGAHIPTCVECRQEMETLRPIIDAFVSWPTDVLRPTTSLWQRLTQRIAAETGGEPAVLSHERWPEPEWKVAGPGISCKLLAIDTEKNRVSMLVRLAPGAEYPPHRHADIEELHLLHGELITNNRKLYPGDYRRAEAGSVDRRVWSETGCTCVQFTSARDTLL